MTDVILSKYVYLNMNWINDGTQFGENNTLALYSATGNDGDNAAEASKIFMPAHKNNKQSVSIDTATQFNRNSPYHVQARSFINSTL